MTAHRLHQDLQHSDAGAFGFRRGVFSSHCAALTYLDHARHGDGSRVAGDPMQQRAHGEQPEQQHDRTVLLLLLRLPVDLGRLWWLLWLSLLRLL